MHAPPFGAVTHAVGHDLSFEATLELIKRIGFSSILLLTQRDGAPVKTDGTCESAFPDVLSSDPANVLKAVRNAGLEIAAVHFAGEIDLSSDEAADRFAEALEQYARRTIELECHCLTHAVPSCGEPRRPTESKADEIARLAGCMNTIADRFAEHELKVAVDIHHTSWVEGLSDCRLLLDSMPNRNAGILLNIGHLTTAESYGWLLIDEYPDRIPVVGWKDHSLAKDRPRAMWSVELGKGDSPFALYIDRFKRHAAERVHLINCEHVPDEERVDALSRSLQYLRALWESVG